MTALGPGANLFPGPPPTRLPSDPKPVAQLTAGDDPAAVAAAFPASSFGWAALAQGAAAAGSWIESYAYARVGYHRGLDSLRRARLERHRPRAVVAPAQPRRPGVHLRPRCRRRRDR